MTTTPLDFHDATHDQRSMHTKTTVILLSICSPRSNQSNRYKSATAAFVGIISCFTARSSAFAPATALFRHSISAIHSPAMKSQTEAESSRRSPRKRIKQESEPSEVQVVNKKACKTTSNQGISSATACNSLAVDNTQLLQDWLSHNHHSYHLSFLSPPQAYAIRCALVDWYRVNRRKLPWRGDVGPYNGSTAGFAKKNAKSGNNGGDIRNFFGAESKAKSKEEEKTDNAYLQLKESNDAEVVSLEKKEISAYGVWVSEIMLQQTRVEAVIPYYLKWMTSFPTAQVLADATPDQVNSHWAGLGFYRRARLLHQGAKRVVEEYDGVVPNTVEELMNIEGIGRYTASAIASIAYGVEVPVVDGNVCRVLSRLTGVANHIKAGVFKDDLGWVMAEKILVARAPDDCASKNVYGSPGEVNQALMELGATYCSPSGTGIEDGDPLKDFYLSTRLGRAIGASKCTSLASIHSKCRLCDPDGVFSVFYDITDRIAESSNATNLSTADLHAISGHATLPTPPPKKAKREEVIAVGVICIQDEITTHNRWLMVKRPPNGLLAGQWEFPSVCLWDSSKENKGKTAASSKAIKVPHINAETRSVELDSYLHLNGILQHGFSSEERIQITDPIVHVFSHVCHTMYVEKCRVISRSHAQKRWKLQDGREAGWFNEEDMQSLGITSGVRKILSLTQI